MEPHLQYLGQWDDWWEEQYKQFQLPDTFPIQEMDTTAQQAGATTLAEGQSGESWNSNEDVRSVGARLDKIEAALHETKNLSNQACDGLRALEHRVGGVGEAVERLKKSLSAFQKFLYRLLSAPADERDKSVVVEFP